MKITTISSIFLLFTIVTGMISMSPASFADHSEVTITPISGSGSGPGCELTNDGCYNPSIATVDVGGVVIFSNTDNVSHTFSSGSPSDDVIGTEFNSGMLSPGDSAEWKPENVGEFAYFDMIHPWMQGLIIVQEAEETHSEEVEETHSEEVEETVVEEKIITQESSEEGGGCLIATAAYGSEMAPQVQMLREIRDNQLMNTESGSAFMGTFNELYYSFSPYIADMERESPMFKEIVKAGLTPMLSTLAIMENAESESEVLGLGLSVIALNLGMYIGLPAFGIVKVIQLRKN